MENPKTVFDITKYIDLQIQENIHLDYKRSEAISRKKTAEISKDVSSFANSDGGIIVYGIKEKDHYPISMDSGIDHSDFTREWIEQVINSNITPRISGIEITQISINDLRSVFVISIPKSFRGPHQAADKKYYKRFNFLSVPMEDFEIKDISNRKERILPLVNVDVELKQGVIVYLIVENIGEFPAYDLEFEFPNGIEWPKEGYFPPLLENGTKMLPVKRKYSFFYQSYVAIINNDKIPKELDVSVNYVHPLINNRICDSFHINFLDYYSSAVRLSENEEFIKSFERQTKDIIKELKSLNSNLEEIKTISGPTGLDLSYSTLINLQAIFQGTNKFKKIDPNWLSHRVFMEVLEIDIDLALKLQQFFRYDSGQKKISEIEGMSDEIYKRFTMLFDYSDEE